MGWKKNALSYLFWFVYTLMAGCVTVALAAMLCKGAGVKTYWGGILALLYIGIVGGVVFLLHHLTAKPNRKLLLVLEAVLAVLFLVLGLVLRMRNIEGVGAQVSDYYEIARVATGQEIPYITHGAVYFYVMMLRGAFSLLGNNLVVGIWIQIALQLAASFALYIVLRRLAGKIAALVTLGFCTCAPYMVNIALLLSPEMLYFCLIAIALGLVCAGHGRKLRYGTFFPIGILAAVCCYVDVAGGLVLLLALAVIFCQREEMPGIGKQMKAVSLCLAGTVLGFMACGFLDAYSSGNTFQEIIQAWGLLFQPEGFQMPFATAVQGGSAVGILPVLGSVAESLLLCGFMVFGIFSFWCDRQKDYMAPYVAAVCGIILAGSYGVFTEEMSGNFYLYLLLTVLAGIGIGQCFHTVSCVQADGIVGEAVGVDECHQPDEAGGGTVACQAEAVGEKTVVSGTAASAPEGEKRGGKQIKFLENPLPLPKKQVKRILDYPIEAFSEETDFDHAVGEDDDFDI